MLILLVLIIVVILLSIRIVRQNYVGLIETFGKFSHSVDAGLHFVIPFAQRMRKVSLALQPLGIPKYSVITKDNADVEISVTLNYKVSDAQAYFYQNTNSEESLIQLIRGHLRDIIGKMTLDEALGSTAQINKDLFSAIDQLTASYGVVVIRVNIDELDPAREIQEAMDQQLTADRRKRAENSKAEGDAQSIELTTTAKNKALLETAKAQADAKKVAADAEKYRIETIQAGLAATTEGYFRDQSIEAFTKVAEGPNNLVVLSKDEVDKLGNLPVAGKLLGVNEKESEPK